MALAGCPSRAAEKDFYTIANNLFERNTAAFGCAVGFSEVLWLQRERKIGEISKAMKMIANS
jgi:hypothetical protein